MKACDEICPNKSQKPNVMQKLIIILSVLLLGLFCPAKGQTNYETQMKLALEEFSEAQQFEQLDSVAMHFDEIAVKHPDNWLPLYYSMLSKTLQAFEMNKKQAIEVSNEMEKDYDLLLTLDPDMSEALTLRGFFRTIKLDKDPQTYGMVLPSAIIYDYNEAILLNPENPRALYMLAYFNIRSAPFYGKDPKQYCPMLNEAKQLYSKESKVLEPTWGEEHLDEIIKTECTE
jgi:hypothetical protein